MTVAPKSGPEANSEDEGPGSFGSMDRPSGKEPPPAIGGVAEEDSAVGHSHLGQPSGDVAELNTKWNKFAAPISTARREVFRRFILSAALIQSR